MRLQTSLVPILLLSALLPTIAQAQTETASAGQAATQTEGGGLEEIVVTALKRVSDSQRTPVVLDVVSGDSLSRVGLVNIASIANLAPAVNFGTANGIYTTVTIRGVSSQDTTEVGDPAVAFNVDGEYINRPLNLAATLFDVDRIEVLRGPQGTLYGRNATAGAINILTNRPTNEFMASATAETGNYSMAGGQAVVNIPLADILAIRVAGIYSFRDGFSQHELGRQTDDEDIKAGRVRLLFNPGPLSVLLTGEIADTGGGGPGTKGILISGPAGTLPTNLAVNVGDRDNFPVGINPQLDTKQDDVRTEISYDLNSVQLFYVGGYRTTEFDQFQNIHGTAIHTSDYQGHARYETLGNELRLASRKDAEFPWQVGLYGFDERQQVLSHVYQGVTDTYAPRDSVYRLLFNYPEVKSRSEAAFGEITFPIVDKLSFTAGARETRDHKSRLGTQSTIDLAAFNASQGALVRYTLSSQNGSSESNRFNWNAVLNYQLAPDNMLYAKSGTGYKSGGFTTVNQYGPEDLTSYEIGSKNRFLGDKIQLNADVFDYNYKNQQISTFITTPSGVTASSTQNAGSSQEYGLELDATALATPDDRVRFTLDYLHARFKQFSAAVTAIGGATVAADLTGNAQPYAPDWTLGLSYDHTFHMAWGELLPRAVSAYKTSYFLTATNYASERQTGFSRTDLMLTYRSPAARYEVTAFVRNVENYRTFTQAAFANSSGANFFRYQFADPRTYGVMASVHLD